MRVGSLCSGYGGLDLAVEAVLPFARTVWHTEVDEAAADTLKLHHPDVPNHGSVITADWSTFEPVDFLTMGVPCQPVSAAGRQKVEADPRWLWPYALRAVEVLRPRGIMFENVRNLISIRGGAVWRGILADMRAAGYAVRWLTVGACAVGAPHHRHRVFALALRLDGRDPGPDVRLDVPECDKVRPVLLPTPVARDGSTRGEGSAEYWAAKHAERGAKGIPLGAAVTLLPTPTANEHTGAGHAAIGGMNLRTVASLLPSPRGSDGKNGGPNQGIASGDIALSSAVIGDRWDKYGPAVAHWESVIGRPAPDPTEVGPRGGNRLSALLPEWMMGLPEGYLTGHSARTDALRMAGNGVCPRHGEHALQLLLEGFGH